MKKQYTYAVSRIRSKELSLLNDSDIQRLLSCNNYLACFQVLQDKGWNTSDGKMSPEEVLKAQEEETFSLIRELVDDISVFDVFLYPIDYNNLKVAVKSVIINVEREDLFLNSGTILPKIILQAIKDKDMSVLPEHMREAAKDSFEAFLHTGDSQLCDIIIDKALMNAVLNAKSSSENAFIKKYAEIFVASANIKIAIRGNKIGKKLDFFKKAMAQCGTLNIDLLAKASVKNQEDIYDYLSITDYKEAVPEIKKSITDFEKWCDNFIFESIKEQRTDSFSIGPLASYILAKENERNAVRMILLAKINNLDNNLISERIQNMYV